MLAVVEEILGGNGAFEANKRGVRVTTPGLYFCGKTRMMTYFMQKTPNTRTDGGVVAGSGDVIQRKTKCTHGLSMCEQRGKVVPMKLKILYNSGLVVGHDVGAGAV
jgi:hypothetical protein